MIQIKAAAFPGLSILASSSNLTFITLRNIVSVRTCIQNTPGFLRVTDSMFCSLDSILFAHCYAVLDFDHMDGLDYRIQVLSLKIRIRLPVGLNSGFGINRFWLLPVPFVTESSCMDLLKD